MEKTAICKAEKCQIGAKRRVRTNAPSALKKHQVRLGI